MAKKKKSAPDGNGASTKAAPVGDQPAGNQTEGQDAQFGVLAQFVKDLSFESPNSPLSLQAPGENPKLEVNVQVQAIKHADDVYEVDLMFEAKAESDAGVIYNIELVYGGMFHASNIPDEYMNQVLFVDAPIVIFPFMRRVVADLTRDGGFQPLLLDPIDFGALYQQNSENASIVDATQAN